MKDNILQFVPKHRMDADASLLEFVDFCRSKLTVFGNLDWDSPCWNITDYVNIRTRTSLYLVWWIKYGENYRDPCKKLMKPPFLDFAKAYFIYSAGIRPKAKYNLEIATIRTIADILEKSQITVTKLNPGHCNEIANLAKKRYTHSAYRIGAKLESFIRFCNSKGFLEIPFEWRNPNQRGHDRNRVGKKFDDDRRKRIPTREDIELLGEAFNLATDQKDVIFASIGVLLMSNPSRICEILTLPHQCEVEKKLPNGDHSYGLRFFPAKGGEPTIKWIPNTMVEATKLAIHKIKVHTDCARKVASWYEDNPLKLFLKEEFEYLRSKKWISLSEFLHCFGFKKNPFFSDRFKSVRYKKMRGSSYKEFFFSDIEKIMLQDLPRYFPYSSSYRNLRYSEMLFVVERHTSHSGNRKSQYWMISGISNSVCISQFSKTTKKNNTLWERLDLKKSDGSFPSITTHQFRHMLNTLAQLGGMSQLNIAIWSGRKEIHQNNAYDHVTADQMLALLKNADDGTIFGPENQIIVNNPSTKKNFLELRFPTAHTTEFGFCVHDFTMLPCQKHRDCINCREHVCIKGDAKKTENVRFHFEVIEGELAKTKEAIEKGYAGANRWYEKHLATYERLKQLLSVLDDPTVPNGTVIHITPENEFMPILEASDERLLSE